MIEYAVVTELPEVGDAGTVYILTGCNTISAPSSDPLKTASQWAYIGGSWKLLDAPRLPDSRGGSRYVRVNQLPKQGCKNVMYLLGRTDGTYFGYVWDAAQDAYVDLGIFTPSEIGEVSCLQRALNRDAMINAIDYSHPGPIAVAFRTVSSNCTLEETQALFDLISRYDRIATAFN